MTLGPGANGSWASQGRKPRIAIIGIGSFAAETVLERLRIVASS